MFNQDSLIYVAGHTGLLGSALVKVLSSDGYKNIITKSHQELELTDKLAVETFLKKMKSTLYSYVQVRLVE